MKEHGGKFERHHIECDADYQRLVGEFVDREVVHRCSYLISELQGSDCNLGYGLQETIMDAMVPDYEQCAEDAGWYENDSGMWNNPDEDPSSDTFIEYESAQEVCEEENLDAYAYIREPYEYWIVTDWLGDRLRDHDECVFEFADFTVWGRTTTGQAIKMDHAINSIYLELHNVKEG